MKADFGYSKNVHSLFGALLGPIMPRSMGGKEEGGHFIPIGLGGGFYIPEADFQLAQGHANITGKVQFVGLAKDGSAIHATREALHVDANCDGFIAWIFPEAAHDR